ncbi:unnamed protein product [Victoria cruziana]
MESPGTFLKHHSFMMLLLLLLLQLSGHVYASRTISMNVIDSCWRRDPAWMHNRMKLAACSVGFAGKMTGNSGRNIENYVVTTPADDPINPQPGSLRYGACLGHRWITFQKDMVINLRMPLLVSSFTTIDGRGANVQIAHGSGILLRHVNNVVVHGLRIHHCVASNPGPVIGPGMKIVDLGRSDGDAIAMLASSKVWIDHNTLYACQDGLIDVTRGSTAITISNNWLRNHVKVMLLGHDDRFTEDKAMRVTVAFNRFGPKCYQRMPRVRHGYAHVVNNYYQNWVLYAIGGSAEPTIRSEGNLFIAPRSENKEVTRHMNSGANLNPGNWVSVNDVLSNGAYFSESGKGAALPGYKPEEMFPSVGGDAVSSITRNAGVLRCMPGNRC